MQNRILVISLAIGIAGPLAACATRDQAPDPGMAQHAERCHFDETWSCVKRMGHTERCFCADKDTLRELLEPTVR